MEAKRPELIIEAKRLGENDLGAKRLVTHVSMEIFSHKVSFIFLGINSANDWLQMFCF